MKNKKIIILTLIILVLVLTIGVSFAIFTYNKTGSNSNLVVGDIYMHYNETNELTIENAMPSSTFDKTKYFEFTIDGKNTYTDKDIWYEIVLTKGNNQTGKTRIKDNLLKFRLTTISNGVETELLNNKSYDDLTNKRIYVDTINKNTTTEITRTYRLYMWVSSDTKIGNVNQDYTMEEWNNVYASIKVKVTGDFNKKRIENSADFKTMLLTEKTNTIIEEDNTVYISGSKTDVDYNYVWYSGKLWRITAINPDGTMKMITDDMITTISYNPEDDANFYDISKKDDTTYTGSWIYQWLNEDFLDTLYNYKNIIVEDSTWNITNSNASSSSDISIKLPETTLINNESISKNTPIGLLNSYEYYLSYKNSGSTSDYTQGYLNIGYGWWLLNPSSSPFVWNVSGYGGNGGGSSTNNIIGVRPSINLKSNIQFSGGSGTKNDPYTISGDMEQPIINTTLLNTRTIGEYVVFDEDGDTSTKELYRIVGIEDGKTKLNKNDNIKNDGTVVEKKFSTNTTYGNGTSDDYWDYYLNNTWYNSLASISMLDKGTYYIKTMSSDYYKNSLCNTNNTTETTKDCVKTTSIWNTGYVGLLRYGEMFASQQGNDYSSLSSTWLITPYSSSYVWYVSRGYGGLKYPSGANYPSGVYGARPSIYLKSNIVITGGNGTKFNPFTITLKD